MSKGDDGSILLDQRGEPDCDSGEGLSDSGSKRITRTRTVVLAAGSPRTIGQVDQGARGRHPCA